MSSNLCTNSNRFNNSISNGSRSSKLNQQQQNSQRTDINSLVDDDNTTDSIGSNNSSSIKHTSWSPSENSNNNNNNINSNNRGNSSLKDQNHISINGDLQQQQQGRCSTKNEALNPLSDMNSQCLIIEQRSKTSISFDSMQSTHSNHSNSIKHDHCSLTSSKSPPLSPSNSSSSSSSSVASNHSLSFRNNENSQWNNNHNIRRDATTINSCNTKSQADMVDKSNSPTEDNSYNVKLSRYSHQQHRRQSNKSNLSSYCMSSDHEMNYNEECQKRQLLGKDLDVEGKKYNEDEEEEREGVEYKNDCVDGAEANGDIDDIDGVNHVDRNNANDDNNDDDDDDDNDDDNDNPYSIDQQTNHHYSTSFPTLTSDSLSNCISPMLAAAAMAALTTGCFPTPCNQLSQLNYSLLSKSYGISQLSPSPTPLHPPPPLTLQPPVPPSSSSSSAHTQRSHITKQQQLAFLNSTPNRNSKVSGTHHSHSHHHQHNNCNNNSVSINSLSSVGCNSSSPIHSIHSNNDGYNTITNNKKQFKQLYVISDDPKRKEFLDELFVYMQRRGTPVNRIPIMAKQVLDLYELFQLVVARGGLVEVINKKLWREITKGLNLPSSITSAAFTLRTQYMKYLYPYECETLGLSSPNELQAAIDGNRREARRSSYTFDYPIMNPPNTSRSTSPVSTTTGNLQTTPTTTTTPNTMTTSNTMPNSPSPLSVNPSLSNSIVYPNSLGFPNGSNSDVNQLLSNIPTGSTSFCTNNLGFNTQFGQFNPFLTIPTGSLPTNGLGLQTSSTISSSATASATVPSNQMGDNPVNLFPSHLLPSMVSGPNFSIIGSHFQGFNTSLNNSDDPFITSSSSSSIQPGTILPGIPNNFTDPNAMAAAAAAAATLFGAGFPTLPGAFTATPPSLPLSLQTTISINTPSLTTTATTLNNSYLVNNSSLINQSDGCLKFPILNNLRNQANHSNPNNVLIDTNESNTSSGLRSKNKLTLHDNDDCQFTSSLPLNLTANETNLINLDEKGTSYIDSDPRSSLMPLDHEKLNNKLQYYNNDENELIALHSDERFIQKDGKDNLLNNFNETDRKVNNPRHRHHHHKDSTASDGDDDDHHNNDGDDDDTLLHTDCSDIHNENIELTCKSNPPVEVNKRELTGTNNTINNSNRLQQTNFSFESEDSNIKTAAQVACQQLWAAAAAAAAGLQCGGIKTPETNNYGVLTGNLNGPLKSSQLSQVESSSNIATTTSNNNSNNNKQIQQLSCSKSSSYSSNKKSNSRAPSHLDTPNAKIPKLSSSNQMNSSGGNSSSEVGGKQCNTGSNLSKKSSDLRKQNEAITMSANLHFNNNNASTGVNNSLSAAQLSMATQNFRIQTQPGAPMGLPQNAIVVTMEMGNILYQGVLFGQLKR
ncbi:unnamed protein product [Schistosoma mattheei]|uniref:ARID domain-containing protein n=1 Tax=Schistosoma mattheei TaxID=31246 RepID=A0AA85BF09_9TREM|nr:unnamed protein product [Schistosoma mattheei]